jgi:hypothetical protein
MKLKDKTLRNVIIASTLIIISVVGYHIYITMYIDLEEYGDEIETIGPPGITNLVPIVIITLVSAIVLEIILILSKKHKDIGGNETEIKR